MVQLTPLQRIELQQLKADFDALCILTDDLKPFAETRTYNTVQRLVKLSCITGTVRELERIEYGLGWRVYKTKEEAQATMNEWLEDLANNGGNFVDLDLVLADLY
ncbi:TPA: hypothetical protein ACSP1Y_004708 [Aeromonas hydrophila]|uniref:hypothetical protein n=1 Tax=Aeromonas caviae TaxID=648 RepID=UPI002B4A43AD|nr:hypothetical protein [Aeromonas caviae]